MICRTGWSEIEDMHERRMLTPASTISVVIPVYNGERYLAEAVASVQAQTRPVSEIIVVDDGSTDGTSALIRSLGAGAGRNGFRRNTFRCIWQRNAGPAAARNAGLHAAQGDVIAFLDADDWWPEASLSQRAACLQQHSELSGVIGATQLMVPAHDETAALVPGEQWQPWGAPQPTLNLGGVLIRRQAFTQIGLCNERYAYAEDADWLLRAREAGLRFGVQYAVALMARRHASNMTNQAELSGRYLTQALRQSLARRRHTTGTAEHQTGNSHNLSLAGLIYCDAPLTTAPAP